MNCSFHFFQFFFFQKRGDRSSKSRYSSVLQFDSEEYRSASPSQIDEMKCIFYNNLFSFSPFEESAPRRKRAPKMRLDEVDEDAANREDQESKEDQERRELESILKELSTSNHLVDDSVLENIKTIFVVGGPGSGRVSWLHDKPKIFNLS